MTGGTAHRHQQQPSTPRLWHAQSGTDTPHLKCAAPSHPCIGPHTSTTGGNVLVSAEVTAIRQEGSLCCITDSCSLERHARLSPNIATGQGALVLLSCLLFNPHTLFRENMSFVMLLVWQQLLTAASRLTQGLWYASNQCRLWKEACLLTVCCYCNIQRICSAGISWGSVSYQQSCKACCGNAKHLPCKAVMHAW